MITKADFELLKECKFDYLTYQCYKSIELATRANGSWCDSNTLWLEGFCIELKKEKEFNTLQEVFDFIKEVTGKDIWDGWVSPSFEGTFFC